jgi:hypothetical protein
LKLSKTSRIVTSFSRHKTPDKEGLLKLFLTDFIVTTFSESQMVTFVIVECDGFCNIKAGRHKKSQKELAKTRLLKLSKISRIVTAFNRHKTESQMVIIVTVTSGTWGMSWLSKYQSVYSLYGMTN